MGLGWDGMGWDGMGWDVATLLHFVNVLQRFRQAYLGDFTPLVKVDSAILQLVRVAVFDEGEVFGGDDEHGDGWGLGLGPKATDEAIILFPTQHFRQVLQAICHFRRQFLGSISLRSDGREGKGACAYLNCFLETTDGSVV